MAYDTYILDDLKKLQTNPDVTAVSFKARLAIREQLNTLLPTDSYFENEPLVISSILAPAAITAMQNSVGQVIVVNPDGSLSIVLHAGGNTYSMTLSGSNVQLVTGNFGSTDSNTVLHDSGNGKNYQVTVTSDGTLSYTETSVTGIDKVSLGSGYFLRMLNGYMQYGQF